MVQCFSHCTMDDKPGLEVQNKCFSSRAEKNWESKEHLCSDAVWWVLSTRLLIFCVHHTTILRKNLKTLHVIDLTICIFKRFYRNHPWITGFMSIGGDKVVHVLVYICRKKQGPSHTIEVSQRKKNIIGISKEKMSWYSCKMLVRGGGKVLDISSME